MLVIRESQKSKLGDESPNTPVVQACEDDPHFIEFRLLDDNGDPVPGEPYRVRLPDKSLHTGTLDKEGKVRFEKICAGQASICFTGLDEKEWRAL